MACGCRYRCHCPGRWQLPGSGARSWQGARDGRGVGNWHQRVLWCLKVSRPCIIPIFIPLIDSRCSNLHGMRCTDNRLASQGGVTISSGSRLIAQSGHAGCVGKTVIKSKQYVPSPSAGVMSAPSWYRAQAAPGAHVFACETPSKRPLSTIRVVCQEQHVDAKRRWFAERKFTLLVVIYIFCCVASKLMTLKLN